MKAKFLLILVLLPFAASAAQGYKIVHPDGTVEYTDQPAKNAEEINLPGAQGYQSSGPSPAATPTSQNTSTTPSTAKSANGDYSQFAIASPRAEETISGTGGVVSVAVRLSPSLQQGHQIVISLDGREVARGASTSFPLSELERGAHLVGAAVVDAGGSTLRQADPVTFYVFQPSILNQRPR